MRRNLIVILNLIGLLFLTDTVAIYEPAHIESDMNLSSSKESNEINQDNALPIKHNISAVWIPDGVISENEYSRRMVLIGEKRGRPTDRSLEIHWSNDAQNFYMALKGQTKGWIAIGFEPSSAMNNSDIILGAINGSNVIILMNIA